MSLGLPAWLPPVPLARQGLLSPLLRRKGALLMQEGLFCSPWGFVGPVGPEGAAGEEGRACRERGGQQPE